MKIRVEAPHESLHIFNGAYTVGNIDDFRPEEANAPGNNHQTSTVDEHPLTMDHLLFRGCTLRDTAWMMGFVIYTGKESKVDDKNFKKKNDKAIQIRNQNVTRW